MELSDITKSFEPASPPIDVRSIFSAFWRRIGLFFATLLLISSLITLATLQSTPIYTSTASLLIDLQERNLFDLESALTGNAPDAGAIETEVEIIRSRALANKVVDKLNLDSDPEFNVTLQEPGAISNILDWFSALVPSPILENTSVTSPQETEHDHVVGQVLEELRVARKGNTYVLNVSFESENAQKSANIANAFADTYLLEQLESKFETTSRANDWLNGRLEELRSEVRSTEEAVEVYRTNSGLLSAQGSSLTEQQISDLNAQLIVQTSEYNEIKARLESVRGQISRGVPPDSIAEVMSSIVIQNLRGQESAVASRKADLSSRYGPRHPEVLKVDRETADIQAQIRQEIDRIVSSLESEAGIAQQKVATINQGLSRLRGELSSNNRSLVRLRELEREAEASRSLYENFLEQFKQIDDQENIAEADARVISRAVVPDQQSSPNTLINILLGILLGIMCGIGMVVLAEMLDNGLSTGADVERIVDVPYITSIPELNPGIIGMFNKLTGRAIAPEQFIVDTPLSMFAESFRTLRSSILLSSQLKSPKIISITSALPNEGKTTVVRSIGRMSAMSGSKTIIIDCDLRLRQLSKGVDVQAPAGIIKLLRGDANLSEVIVKDDKTECEYILCKNDEYSKEDLFSTQAFTEMLESLRNQYDLIILDTAPVLMVAETRVIGNLSDAVVLVARWRKTKADAVKAAADILRKVDSKIIGLVLSRVNTRKRIKYGAGDYSYYVRQYGNYYVNKAE